MGTSSSFGGASGATPLVPSWLDDGAGGGATPPSDGTQPVDGALPADGAHAPLVPAAPTAQPTPRLASSDRYTSARSNLTRFASSGGSDHRSLGRAVSQYVSTASGGSRQAAARMGSSRGSAAKLVNFLSDAQANGAREALKSLNLEALAGRPIEEVFIGLADYVCPEGGTIDEGIARDAFIETIADLSNAGITDIDGLTTEQIQTVFELYATHAIEARLCNDIGLKTVRMPADVSAAQRVQSQLRDFIQRGVSDALNTAQRDTSQPLTIDRTLTFVTSVYQSAFAILQTLGDAEADK